MTGRITIIGAGLGGLTAALALQQGGWRVRVYEQARALGEAGAGITLSSGAGMGLASLGLGPALLAASLPVPDIAFVDYRTGALLAGSFDNTAPPDLGFAKARHIHRADLHAILLAAVRAHDSDSVLADHRVTAVTQNGAGVTASFANGATAGADALIAADGVRSSVRRLLFDDQAPVFAGQIAFRCLIPRAIAEPFLSAGNAVVSIGPGRVFNRYVIRHGALVNVIGIARTEGWAEEGWSTPASVEEFAGAFEDFHEDVLGLIQRAPAQSLIKWGLFVRPPSRDWVRGRVLMMGDAAHAMLPFLGLGAATAIEDGIVLARALAQADGIEAGFVLFERARAERVELVRSESVRQGEIIQGVAPDVARAPSQNVALFEYNPVTAPL